MKKTVVMLGILFTLAGCGESGESSCWMGGCKLRHQGTVMYGPVTFNGNTFDGQLTIYGTLDANEISAQATTVYGTADIKNSTITGPVVVQGFLKAHKSTFNDAIKVYGTTELDDCVVQNILVKKTEGQPSEITLTGDCVVKGSITFESGQGVVHAKGSPQILGRIKGGVLD